MIHMIALVEHLSCVSENTKTTKPKVGWNWWRSLRVIVYHFNRCSHLANFISIWLMRFSIWLHNFFVFIFYPIFFCCHVLITCRILSCHHVIWLPCFGFFVLICLIDLNCSCHFLPYFHLY
jgi:hypothetical protein